MFFCNCHCSLTVAIMNLHVNRWRSRINGPPPPPTVTHPLRLAVTLFHCSTRDCSQSSLSRKYYNAYQASLKLLYSRFRRSLNYQILTYSGDTNQVSLRACFLSDGHDCHVQYCITVNTVFCKKRNKTSTTINIRTVITNNCKSMILSCWTELQMRKLVRRTLTYYILSGFFDGSVEVIVISRGFNRTGDQFHGAVGHCVTSFIIFIFILILEGKH